MSDGIRDFSEAFDVHILVMPEHFGGGVADQAELVFVWRVHIFHQGGESVPAGMRRVFVPAGVSLADHGIVGADSLQRRIESITICFDGHGLVAGRTEHGAADLVFCQIIDDRLDFWRDSYNSVLAGVGLGAANEGALLSVVELGIQRQ